jgi:iron complex outermembrane receptor protein
LAADFLGFNMYDKTDSRHPAQITKRLACLAEKAEPASARRLRDTPLAAGALLGAVSLGAMSLAALPQVAFAQQSSPSAAATSGGLVEVIVTARHTRENAQKTPIAMSVYNSDKLKLNNVTDITALSTVAPDVSITVTEGQPIVSVRGISSRDTTENGDPAVTVDTDGFYVNRPFGLSAAMYDLDRIEVLRGPQGTLNGRNSVGGALNVITAKPVKTFAANASVQYGNFDDLEVQSMVNVPIGDKVQTRVAVLSASHDGYRSNSQTIAGDSEDNKSARVEVAFQPTDRLSGLITAQYTSQGGSGDVLEYIPFKYASTGALIHDLPAGISSSTFALGTQPFYSLKDTQFRYNFGYDAGAFQVTFLGGYDRMVYAQAIDQTLAGSGNPYQWRPSQTPVTTNEELRVSSKPGGKLQWQFGGFLFNEKAHLLSGDFKTDPNGAPDYFFGFVYATKSASKAVYAQASYQLTDTLKLTAGVRDTKDSKWESGWYGIPSANIVFANTAGEAKSSKATYHLSADYDLAPANMLYAKFDTGYKAGGFNVGAADYAPETVNAYEIGSKNRFFDNSLQLNIAAFYDDYSNQQVAAYTTLPTGQAVALTLNAGASHISGAESSVVYRFAKDWTVDFDLDYLHARYVKFLAIADPSDPKASGNVQLAGNTPPQSPEVSFGGGIEKTWDALNGNFTARLQTKAQSASNFSFYNFADTRQKGYAMSSAFLTYEPSQAKWKLVGYVRNIEDAKVFRDAEESQYAGGYAYGFLPPRTYGVRYEYSW